jgi:glycosyltransferase involved in cell wall biosynthesis
MNKILVISYHPVPYRNHIFDRLTKEIDLSLRVLYWDWPDLDRGLEKNVVLNHDHIYLSKSLFKLNKFISEYKPDLTIISGLTSVFAIFTILLCKIKRYKHAIHSESHDLKERNITVKTIRDLLYKFLLKDVDIIFPTSTLAEIYLNKYLTRNVSTCLFPNAPSFNEINERIKVLRNGIYEPIWQIPLNVLYVGRLIKEKNLEVLLKAWKICETKSLNAKLIIIGDGYHRKYLEGVSKNLNLKSVVFLGRKNNMEIFNYYANAHLFILPSVEEPYGAVVNEAISAGLPIIISNRVGCKLDTLKEGLNGFTFKFFNPEDLSIKILCVLSKQNKWENMCKASTEIAKNFDSEIINENIKRAILNSLKNVSRTS